ncbi:hypothetical protein Bhyg_11069 [Pseudolycoriella hygida]|uniref:Uncharacterized protein n=1 Tax=Pseudolycoriella hygida TaxID=35572 RepID=A0A9Q0MW95_9DIPT|nr:hypothetical protein Bhyg_11069 [Pseudolycoriella hygida]
MGNFNDKVPHETYRRGEDMILMDVMTDELREPYIRRSKDANCANIRYGHGQLVLKK